MSDHEVSKPAPAHDVDGAVDAAPADPAAPAGETAEPVVDRSADAQRQDAQDAPDEQDAATAPTSPAHEPESDGQDRSDVAQGARETLADAADAADAARPTPDAGRTGAPAADADLAAFAEAEAAYPGTFGGTFTPPPPAGAAPPAETAVWATAAPAEPASEADTVILAPAAGLAAAQSGIVAPADAAPLPIFVQAPEAPRVRGNRGAIFGIGLLAALGFAVLYLGTALGVAALTGTVGADGIGAFLLDQVRSAGLWLPVLLFAIGFWLLGAVINRARWGYWVVFGIIVGVFAYAGHLLGAIGSVEFWKLSTADLARIVNAQLLAPLAVAAFIFGRELTVWFGAWAARTGARRTEANDEAQREYERILEAGPQLSQ